MRKAAGLQKRKQLCVREQPQPQRQADFIDIVAWRAQAEFVCKYFQKGNLIAIEGSLQTRQYQDKNGSNRTAVEVVTSNVSFAGSKAADKPATASYEQQTAKSCAGSKCRAQRPAGISRV